MMEALPLSEYSTEKKHQNQVWTMYLVLIFVTMLLSDFLTVAIPQESSMIVANRYDFRTDEIQTVVEEVIEEEMQFVTEMEEGMNGEMSVEQVYCSIGFDEIYSPYDYDRLDVFMGRSRFNNLMSI